MEANLSNLIGRQIRLLHTHNRYNKMKYGEIATIIGTHHDVRDNEDEIAVLVELDNGSRVTLFTPGDLFAFVD